MVLTQANGGDYVFLNGVDDAGAKLSLPVHQTFWDYLFMHNKNWGLINYQQDWMFTQQGMEQMLENVTLARTWTLQMSEALVRNELNFGFGGSTTKNWLQSTEMYAVTNGRISMDYHAGLTEDNWRIGLASIFAWSIAVIPAKDGESVVLLSSGTRNIPWALAHLRYDMGEGVCLMYTWFRCFSLYHECFSKVRHPNG